MTPLWWLTKDGDYDLMAMYERHYSSHRRKRRTAQFVAPGEHIVLRTESGNAMFVWWAGIDYCIDERTGERQEGVNCAVFRNESHHLSSELVRQADAIADFCWPDRRHYTYVNPQKLRSTNAGFCFLKAGWQRCGRSRGGLLILERVRNAA